MAWLGERSDGAQWENNASQALVNNGALALVKFQSKVYGSPGLAFDNGDTRLRLISPAQIGWWLVVVRIVVDPLGNAGSRIVGDLQMPISGVTQGWSATCSWEARNAGLLVVDFSGMAYYPGPDQVPGANIEVRASLAGAAGNRSIVADGACVTATKVAGPL